MKKTNFAELLQRAKAHAAAARAVASVDAATILQEQLKTVDVVDTSLLGITKEMLQKPEGEEQAVDIIRDVIDTLAVGRGESRHHADEYYGGQIPPAVETKLRAEEVGELEEPIPATGKILGVTRDIILNEKQQQFHDLVLKGEDCICVGAAGTGKTTGMRKITRSMIDTGHVAKLRSSTKWLCAGLPGIVVLSYTRKAVNNIRHAVVEELKQHTITIHKMLEFAPIFYEIEDPAKPGTFKKTMRFEPQRNRNNPLPPDLLCAVYEESSMVGVDLKHLVNLAMPHKHQEIYIGDIQQLPPIFGAAILGFKMLELPIVELTEVYRQALESPIINVAWKLLGGNPNDFSSKQESYKQYSEALGREVTRIRVPALELLSRETDAGSVKFQVWQKRLSPDNGLNTTIKQFNHWADNGYYNPNEDIILCPYHKPNTFGCFEIDRGIAQHLGIKREAVVHEVIAGFNKHYLAVGDRVMYDKEDAFIIDIAKNSEYLGKRPKEASKNLSRWGTYIADLTDEEKLEAQASGEMSEEALESFMKAAADASGDEDRVNAASHVVTIKLAYGDEQPIELESAGDINNILGGYAITVHKAQGSEWEKVFFVMSQTHAVMNQRELLYTAVTRASKHLHIICEPNTFEKGIMSQRIKGNTLAEKAEQFKGRLDEYNKQQELLKEEAGEFKSGTYKGNVPTQAPDVKTPDPEVPKTSSTPLIKMDSFIPDNFRQLVQSHLNDYWETAIRIYGEKIGDAPRLGFNLQTHRALGMAYPGIGLVALNPVWCLVALDDQKVMNELLDITLPHELCHIINARFNKGKGHDAGWKMCMRLAGIPPDVTYEGDDLPPWTAAYLQIVEKKKKELEGKGADISEDSTSEEE